MQMRQAFSALAAVSCRFCRFFSKVLPLLPDSLVVRGNNLPLLIETANFRRFMQAEIANFLT